MTDKELIKALVSCIEGYCPTCFYGNTDQRHCKDDLMQNALDLINRLQAENEHYSHNVKEMTDSIRNYQKALEQAKAEIERLQQNLEEAHIDIREHITKIEGLLFSVHSLSGHLSSARAEAIKEFAERLKEKYKHHILCGYEVINGELDDLVKEMVGEDK